MARKTMWAGVAVLLAFAPGAAAATYGLSADNKQTYASELFGAGGGDLTIDYKDGDSTPMVTLTLGLIDTESDNVEVGHTADVTITLSNAKFARNVLLGSFSTTVTDPTDSDTAVANATVTVSDKRAGGSRGDSSVTVRLTAAGTDAGWDDAANGADVALTLALPPLTGLNATRPVSAVASVDSSATGSGLVRSSAATARDAGSRIANGVVAMVPSATVDTVLVAFSPAVTFVRQDGGSSDIDLAGDRTSLLPATFPIGVLGSVRAGVTNLGSATAAVPLQLDGDPFSVGRREDGAGVVNVTVTGDFRDGDAVYLDMNRDGMPGSDETLSIDGGVAEGGFALVDVTGNPSVTGSDDASEAQREEGVPAANRAVAVLYRPNGRDALRPGQFRTMIGLDYNEAANRDNPQPAGSFLTYETMYSDVEDDQKAYAIPPMGSSDVGNVRVKCEVSAGCTVYLECDDQAGDSWFAEVGEIDGRATMVMQSAAIAEDLEVGEDGWEGRLSCTVYSSRTISVQVLTRSGGALVNNTYIDQ